MENDDTLWESIAFNSAWCGEIRVGKGDACEEQPGEGAQDILEWDYSANEDSEGRTMWLQQPKGYTSEGIGELRGWMCT